MDKIHSLSDSERESIIERKYQEFINEAMPMPERITAYHVMVDLCKGRSRRQIFIMEQKICN